MAHLYLTRTVHMPVSADGRMIKNSFGVVIAEAHGDGFEAQALAEIINLGFAAAKAVDDKYDETERNKFKLLR